MMGEFHVGQLKMWNVRTQASPSKKESSLNE